MLIDIAQLEELKGVRRFVDVEDYIKNQAKLEIETTISQTLGEYLGESPEDPPGNPGNDKPKGGAGEDPSGKGK